jgi:hypothetical protein
MPALHAKGMDIFCEIQGSLDTQEDEIFIDSHFLMDLMEIEKQSVKKDFSELLDVSLEDTSTIAQSFFARHQLVFSHAKRQHSDQSHINIDIYQDTKKIKDLFNIYIRPLFERRQVKESVKEKIGWREDDGTEVKKHRANVELKLYCEPTTSVVQFK